MPSSYRITEPHPSLPASHIYFGGRGGAGNATRVNPQDVTPGPDASGPASRIKLSPPSNTVFATGRGGAGNMHRERERAMFSFDEELAQQERLREHAAPVYHIGRGGAGNLVDDLQRKTTRANSTSSNESTDSDHTARRSNIESAWHKVSRQFSRSS